MNAPAQRPRNQSPVSHQAHTSLSPELLLPTHPLHTAALTPPSSSHPPIPHLLPMSSALARYESFLIHNGSTIASLESTLRSLTWLLPGRFKDAELVSEACPSIHPSLLSHPLFIFLVLVSASVNALSLYHDTLLHRAAGNEPKYRPLLPPSLHSRFTRAWADTHTRYRWTARTLELIRFVELLVEMGLRRKVNAKSRWRAITLLEALK